MKCILLAIRFSLCNSFDKLFAIFTLGLYFKEIFFIFLLFCNFSVIDYYILAEYQVTLFFSDVLLSSELDQILIILVILPDLVILVLNKLLVSLLTKTLLTNLVPKLRQFNFFIPLFLFVFPFQLDV